MITKYSMIGVRPGRRTFASGYAVRNVTTRIAPVPRTVRKTEL